MLSEVLGSLPKRRLEDSPSLPTTIASHGIAQTSEEPPVWGESFLRSSPSNCDEVLEAGWPLSCVSNHVPRWSTNEMRSSDIPRARNPFWCRFAETVWSRVKSATNEAMVSLIPLRLFLEDSVSPRYARRLL